MPDHHVFVLDDDPEITQLIRRTCMVMGVPTTVFNTIGPFKDVVEFPSGAVILLDLNLGEGNGIDILRFLAGRHCQAAIYLMSGVDERLLATVLKLGRSYGLDIRGILQKPFRIADLKEKLQAGIGEAETAPRRRASREEELHRATMGGELRLHYQPKIDIRSGTLVGCEALVRWQHSERGLVPPPEFLPLAEETGLIVPITHWVLQEAIRQSVAWRRQGLSLNISVNVPADMLNELALPTVIEHLLASNGVAGSCLTLEVTEAAAMRDLLTTVDVLARLRLMGISLSIDDFGTGHASMIKLRQLPFNEIKIDQTFVRDMTTDPEAKSLVETMIAIGINLRMKIVAEGVEDAEALALLGELGCDAAQGYYVSRPLPAAAFEEWAKQAPQARPDGSVAMRRSQLH